MRITNAVINDRLLRNIQAQNQALAEATQQVATGIRHEHLSDDPVAGAAILRADRGIRAVAQYRRSVTSVQTRLDAEESTLDTMTDVLGRAKEIGMGQGGDNANPSTRAAAATEVQALIDQMISMGNLRVGNEYVFGGTEIGAPPFQANGTYVGTALGRQAEIGANVTVDTVHSGQQLMVDSGVLSSLKALHDALVGGDAATVRGTLAGLDNAYSATQSNLAEVGARTRALDGTAAQLEALNTSYTNERAANANIPIEEATLHLAEVQTALQAAFLSTSKILNTSLTEYLR